MRYGVTLPNFGIGADPRIRADLAREAEQAGWEAVFVWDAIPFRVVDEPEPGEASGQGWDAWIGLTAAALATERVLLGTMITPLAWRKPWQVAFQSLSLDQLSGGRFVLPVGLGALHDGRAPWGEEADRRVRAEMLDEGLAILEGLWTGEAFGFTGRHFRMDPIRMLPRPVRQPRIPIWVVGAWPRPKSMGRAVRYDGILPNFVPGDGRSHGDFTPDDMRAMVEWIRRRRPEPFQVVWEGDSDGPATVRPWAEAGATWWLEATWTVGHAPADVGPIRERIQAGPPRLY